MKDDVIATFEAMKSVQEERMIHLQQTLSAEIASKQDSEVKCFLLGVAVALFIVLGAWYLDRLYYRRRRL